jgi:hypothetical protein
MISNTIDIDRLNSVQKIKLVDEILSSLGDLPLSPALRRELERRDKEMDVEGGIPWSAVKKRMTIK